MEHDFFIHGKPNNADFYGSDNFNGLSERIKDEFFASNSLDTPYLQAEIREWKNDLHSIYTYYVPNQRDTSNRPSYFAITLITKGMMCSRLFGIYRLFEQTYSIICSKINMIDPSGKFKVNYFTDVNVSILPESFIGEINKRFGNDFVAIPNRIGNSHSDRQIQQFNPDDGDFVAVQSALLERGKILLSKNVESIAQKANKADKLEDENTKLKKELQQLQSLKPQNEDLKKQLKSAEHANGQLQTEVNGLAKQINDYKEAKNKSEKELRFLAGQLQEPIEQILDKFKTVRSETAKSKSIWLRMSRFIPVLNFLLLLLLGFLCYKWIGNLKKNPEQNQIELLSTELDSTKDQLKNLHQQNEALRDTVSQLKIRLSDPNSTTAISQTNTPLSSQTQKCTITMKDSEGNIIANGATLYEGTIVQLSVFPQIDGYTWYGRRMSGIDKSTFSNVQGTLTFWKSDNDSGKDNQPVLIYYGPHSKNADGSMKIDETNKVTLKIKRKTHEN